MPASPSSQQRSAPKVLDQNQALSAIVFLYADVLDLELDWLSGLVRARRPMRLPVVLTHAEAMALLVELRGSVALMARLMYGAGLRLLECVELRVKDVDFSSREIRARDGKGAQGSRNDAASEPGGAARQPPEARPRLVRTRPCSWRRMGGVTGRAESKVSQCGTRVELAMGVSGHPDIRGRSDERKWFIGDSTRQR
jgi:integrase